MQFMQEPGAQTMLAHARIAVGAFVFLLALLVFFAAREMFGEGAALLSLLLFVFDPMILGNNGPLLGTDVSVTCFLFAAESTFPRYVDDDLPTAPWPLRPLAGHLAGGEALRDSVVSHPAAAWPPWR